MIKAISSVSLVLVSAALLVGGSGLAALGAEAQAPPIDQLERALKRGDIPTSKLPLGKGKAKKAQKLPNRGPKAKLGQKRGAQSVKRPTGRGLLKWQGFTSPTYRQAGKLYSFYPNNLVGSCTAAVVARNLVLTAAHCVGGDMWFVPGHTATVANPTNVVAPYGWWKVYKAFPHTGYSSGTGRDFDWAILEMTPRSDQKMIGDIVGGFKIFTNVTFSQGAELYSIGYPSDPKGIWGTRDYLLGNGQYACWDRWDGSFQRSTNGLVELFYNCSMNRGSSGGPLLARLNAPNSGWWVVGVNNQCFGGERRDGTYCVPYSTHLRSWTFDSRFQQFWNSVVQQLTY